VGVGLVGLVDVVDRHKVKILCIKLQ